MFHRASLLLSGPPGFGNLTTALIRNIVYGDFRARTECPSVTVRIIQHSGHFFEIKHQKFEVKKLSPNLLISLESNLIFGRLVFYTKQQKSA